MQPSIYPAPETQLLLQEVHSPLEAHIGTARRQTTDALAAGHAQVQGAVDRWIGVEHAVECALSIYYLYPCLFSGVGVSSFWPTYATA